MKAKEIIKMLKVLNEIKENYAKLDKLLWENDGLLSEIIDEDFEFLEDLPEFSEKFLKFIKMGEVKMLKALKIELLLNDF